MPQNMTEATLEGLTLTIALIEGSECPDEHVLKILKENRENILKRLNLSQSQ
jgi:hypothetical protein